MDFFAWTDDTRPAAIVDVTAPGAWQDLYDFYTDRHGDVPLRRIFEIAMEHGVQSILIEKRYLDADWRSEHAEFYSTTFVRYPSVAHRLHFFTVAVPADLSDLRQLSGHYIGYTVLRPIPSRPVGRTMISPPPELADAVRCEAVETVNVLGWAFRVCGMPFISQDAQYMRCAHADIWMAMRHAYLLGLISRKTCAQVHKATMGGVVAGREIPSDGLSIHQMLSGMTALGLSPGLKPLPATKAESDAAGSLSLFAIICRYINSNISPIVASDNHVWVIVAYKREQSQAHTGLTLFRHDDARGPYLRVDDPWNEPATAHKPWGQTLLPLPPKIYMAAEDAEIVGQWWFELRLRALTGDVDDPLLKASTEGNLTYRTYGVGANQFKEQLASRARLDSHVSSRYRLSLWPRNLWIIEAIDRSLRGSGHEVLGEVIVDPTATQYPTAEEPGILAVHAPGILSWVTPDTKVEQQSIVGRDSYESGRPTYSA